MILLYLFAIIPFFNLLPQADFISVEQKKFFSNGEEIFFLGFNAYFLQSIYSHPDGTFLIDKVFKISKDLGIRVIRTWAFNEGNPDEAGIIRSHPYKYSEEGLLALDFVVSKAKANGIKLILTLANNYPAYGGINQYIEWGNNLLQPVKPFTHIDFFTDDSIKSWYRSYLATILNRENYFTKIKYNEEPAIFSFELINEAESSGNNPEIIYNWYDEMSRHFKSLDSHHLLTTGEIGYDANPNLYSDMNLFYNGSSFLLDGYKGTSYFENSSLEFIDYASFHLYPAGWHMNEIAGSTWIKDHIKISDSFNKPALLGEFGVTGDKYKYYKKYLEEIRNTASRSAVVWNYMPQELEHMNDHYAFNETANPELFELFKEHIALINSDHDVFEPAADKSFELFQNFPNPFNPITTIKYRVNKPQYIKAELFTSLGERIGILVNEFQEAGEYEINLSFDNSFLGSGTYFYTFQGEQKTEVMKMILLK